MGTSLRPAAMRFDWKDGLLLSAGMIVAVALLVALKEGLGVSADDGLVELVALVAMGGPVAARRAIFGWPRLPEPRKGALASIVSIVGLLATLSGLLVLALGTLHLKDTFAAPPDFEAQALAASRTSGIHVEVVLDGLVEGSAEERERQREADAREAAAAERSRWEQDRADRRRFGFTLLAVGVALVALGALANFLRYPRPAAAST
jgi:hypothetical protein